MGLPDEVEVLQHPVVVDPYGDEDQVPREFGIMDRPDDVVQQADLGLAQAPVARQAPLDKDALGDPVLADELDVFFQHGVVEGLPVFAADDVVDVAAVVHDVDDDALPRYLFKGLEVFPVDHDVIDEVEQEMRQPVPEGVVGEDIEVGDDLVDVPLDPLQGLFRRYAVLPLVGLHRGPDSGLLHELVLDVLFLGQLEALDAGAEPVEGGAAPFPELTVEVVPNASFEYE